MSIARTRLLVLGVVRIFGPVHGYDVRRELLTWQLQDWTNIQPGSIYSALRTLEKDEFIEPVEPDEHVEPDETSMPAGSPESGGAKAPKRLYRITAEGEKVFAAELRAAWWRVERAADPLIPALCLMPFMPRVELIAALGARVHQLTAEIDRLRFQRSAIRDGATGAEGGVPEHVREILDFAMARVDAEIAWSRALIRRLEAGEYWFADETAPADRLVGRRAPGEGGFRSADSGVDEAQERDESGSQT